MVSPTAIEIVSTEHSQKSGDSNNNNAMEANVNQTNTDMLRITPSVVIGKVVSSNSSLLSGKSSEIQEALLEGEVESTNAGSLVIAIVPKSLENRKSSIHLSVILPCHIALQSCDVYACFIFRRDNREGAARSSLSHNNRTDPLVLAHLQQWTRPKRASTSLDQEARVHKEHHRSRLLSRLPIGLSHH